LANPKPARISSQTPPAGKKKAEVKGKGIGKVLWKTAINKNFD